MFVTIEDETGPANIVGWPKFLVQPHSDKCVSIYGRLSRLRRPPKSGRLFQAAKSLSFLIRSVPTVAPAS
jgi:hypothetical protein